MKKKATVEGRSFVFNALFVLLNLIGLVFVVVGAHKSFEDKYLLFSFIGYLIMALSAGGLLIFQGRLMMANVARVLVGGLFIVSGLVKANDPLGFAYKLEEYFEDGALAYRIKELFGAPGFSFEFLIEWALFLSVVICIFEIVLGVLTIIGGKIKLVAYLMMAMMIFFTFLTWHTASCDSSKKFVDRDTYEMSNPIAGMKLEQAKTNKEIKIISKENGTLVIEEMKSPQCVDDCGCFGDAMKGSVGRSLTPKESLWKDIILLYLVFWIFIAQWLIEPNSSKGNVRFVTASMLVIIFFSWVFGWYFPIAFGLVAIIAALWLKRGGGVLFGNWFGASLVVTVLCLFMVGYVLMYEPLKDYRPYAAGSNLIEKMNDGIEGKYESALVYKNKQTGETIEYLASSQEYIDSKIWEDENWEYLDMTQKEIIPTRIPSITDQFNPFLSLADVGPAEKRMEFVKEQLKNSKIKGFKLLDLAYNSEIEVPEEEYNKDDYPDSDYKMIGEIQLVNPAFTEVSASGFITSADRVMVLTVKSMSKANWNNAKRYKELYEAAKVDGIPFIMICNGSREEIVAFRKKYKMDIPVFLNDETELKAIARSNPALLVIEKGIVKGKYPHRSTPSYSWLTKNIFNK
jgi:uncharacterized membrane protein YphA (DoxX/SURF4 family)